MALVVHECCDFLLQALATRTDVLYLDSHCYEGILFGGFIDIGRISSISCEFRLGFWGGNQFNEFRVGLKATGPLLWVHIAGNGPVVINGG